MLRIHDLVFDAWGRRFFDHASALVPAGAKVGLVGRNGAGKSTLFRLIKGELSPADGEISLPRAARIGAVDQEHPATAVSLIDTILAADAERASLTAQLTHAPPEALAEIYARLNEIGADAAPARAAEILGGLGFSLADLDRPMAEFSGGWRMRVAMAAALFAEPDLLLLDEPTNYLDLEGALWLEARLRRYPRMALVISHDRELLDHSVDGILHLTEGRLDWYAGGYSRFEAERADRQRLRSATSAKIESRRAHMQAFVDRFGASAAKARQAQSRLKMIARLATAPPAVEEGVTPFHLPSAERPLAPPLVTFEDATVGYDGTPVLSRINLRLDPDDRIGLLGVNGSGKSTLAKLIAGDLAPLSGRVSRHARIRVGWFRQHQIESLDPDDTPLSIIRRALPDAAESQRRSRLAQFGMTADKVETRVANLSGGEQARLVLNLVAMGRPHLLILDEPTNHLDIDSRGALRDALNAYEGAVILITHDRSLMELVADRLWRAADGAVTPFDGDMGDYARFVVDRPARPERGGPATPPRAPRAPRAALSALAKGLKAAEAEWARLNGTLADMDAALADPALYADGANRADGLRRERFAAAERLAVAEAAWLAAAEAHEEALSGEARPLSRPGPSPLAPTDANR